MKKLRTNKAKLIGMAMLAAGAATVIPAVVPQITQADTVITIPYGTEIEYRSEEKTITRTAHFMYDNGDGTSKPVISVNGDPLTYSASRKLTRTAIYDKKTGKLIGAPDWGEINFDFPEWECPKINGYTPDPAKIPAKHATGNDENEDVFVYYKRNTTTGGGSDSSSGNESGSGTGNSSQMKTETKKVERTIKYVLKYSDGREKTYGSATNTATFTRIGTENNMPAWMSQTFNAVTVPDVPGFEPDIKTIPAITFTPDNPPEDVVVYYTQFPTKTESKTIKRTIKFIGRKSDGSEFSLGSATQSITLYRTVYTDSNGKTQVLSDWGTGTLSAYSVPDRTGYTRTQDTVPALSVTANTPDTEVKVYYDQFNSFTGVRKDADGIWRIYIDNNVDISFTGLQAAGDGNIYYFTNGVHNTSYNNKLVKYSDGKWYFVKYGVLDTSFTGLGQSPNGKWYYVKNGLLDKTYNNKLAKSSANGKWYFVRKGILDKTFTGLGQSPNGKWYYVKNGLLDKTYTGLAVSAANGYLYYAKNGILDKTFNGSIEYQGKVYKVINGRAY